MTSTLSKNKTNVFWTRVVQHIKESTAFAIIITIILLFISVINIVNFASYPRMYRYDASTGEETASHIYFAYEDLVTSVFDTMSVTFICMILAALIAVKCFRHLHKKSLVDLEYSLPLTNNQRFLASAVATIVLIIGATMVSALITHILAYSMLNDSTEFGEMFAKSGGKFADVADLFLKYHMVSLSEMLLLVAIGVLALSCCGVLFDAVVYAGGGSILVALTVLLVQSIMHLDHYKFVAVSFGSKWVAYITPFFSALDGYYSYFYIDGVVNLSSLTSLCIGRYLISAALCVAAFFIHRKRRAEGVGKPVVFKPFYYAVTTILMFCLTATAYNSYLQSEFNAYDDYDSKGTVIMVGMIMFFAFLVLEVLAERKSVFAKKRVIQGAVRFAVTVPLCLAAVVGLREFGKNAMVDLPDAEEISMVNISCYITGDGVEYLDNDEIRFDESKIDINPAVFDSERFHNSCNFTNKEAVEDVLAFAEEVNEFEKNYLDEHGDFYVFDVYSHERDSVKMYCYVDIFTKDDKWLEYSFDLSQDFVKQWVEEYLTDDETYDEYSSDWY